ASTLANASEKAAHVSKDSLHCANVPLYDLIDLSVLKVSDLVVTSYENNSLSPVRVRNVANKAIESILLLIEFLDVANNHLETSLYYATIHRFPDNLLRVQKGFGVQRLTSSLGPNSDLDLSAVSNLVLLTCPASAVISKAEIRFSDGSTWSQSSPNWRTDPVFKDTRVDLNDFPRPLPLIFFATVELNINGEARVIETGDTDDQLRQWLQTQMNSWSIVAGDQAPLGANSQLFRILFRIYGRGAKRPGRRWMLQAYQGNDAIIVADVEAVKSRARNLPVVIGGAPAVNVSGESLNIPTGTDFASAKKD